MLRQLRRSRFIVALEQKFKKVKPFANRVEFVPGRDAAAAQIAERRSSPDQPGGDFTETAVGAVFRNQGVQRGVRGE